MLDREEFVAGATGFLISLTNGCFQFFTEHLIFRVWNTD